MRTSESRQHSDVTVASTAASAHETTVIELSIVMPCLNEAETLTACIEQAQAYLSRAGIAGEVVIADNGSTDGSQALAHASGARVVDVPMRGYGAALYHGVRASRGTFVIMGDSDRSYDFSRLDAFVAALRAGHDLVMGNRFRGGIAPGAMPWKNRYLGNPVLTAIGRAFFRSPAGDFHCGLRGFSRAAFDRLDLRTTGMEFASEMVIKSTLMGLSIVEVPTTLSPDGRSRPPHLRPWRDGWRHLRFMLLYSPKWLFVYPGLALMLVGLVAGARILVGPWVVGAVGLDVHTLLYCAAAVSIGFQAVCFGVFTKVFASGEGLLPPDARLGTIFKVITLEAGLIAGAAMFLLGAAGTAYALWFWSATGFGALDKARMLRIVIPSVLALTLGAQTVVASFFLSVLGLRTRTYGPR